MRKSDESNRRIVRAPARALLGAALAAAPFAAFAQASPFMTGATALQANLLAWLTPIAIILIMVLGGMAMANRMSWGWCLGAILGIAQVSATYGAGPAQTVVENCSNTLILRCAGSENGGTSQFASKLIGEREVRRRTIARSRDHAGPFGARDARRSTNLSDQTLVETAVLPSEIERLPDLRGYLKLASTPAWYEVALDARRDGNRCKSRR